MSGGSDLGGERLPAAFYAVLPNHRRGIQSFWSSVFYVSFCIRSLAGDRYVSPAVLWTLLPEGGSEPLTSAPRSDFMMQSSVLSIGVCGGLSESRLFESNVWVNFSWGRFWPTILAQHLARNCCCRFFQVWNFFWEDLRAAVRKSYGRDLWNSTFFWQYRVYISIGQRHCFII